MAAIVLFSALPEHQLLVDKSIGFENVALFARNLQTRGF